MKLFSRFMSRVMHEVVDELLQEDQSRHYDDDESRTSSRRNSTSRTEELGRSLVCTSLTVWRKSLVMNCKGFTVIDSSGNLVYRVDNYILHPHHLILMDASGKSLLTMRRRTKLVGLLVDSSWFVYEGGDEMAGESREESPVCCVRKRRINNVFLYGGNPKVQAHVYRTGSPDHAAFTVEGSYAHRTCRVLDESKDVVAEIKRKETHTQHVSFGIEIFQLIVHPGFDPTFAMALVLLLDQMFSS